MKHTLDHAISFRIPSGHRMLISLIALLFAVASGTVGAASDSFFDLAPVSGANAGGGTMPSQRSGRLSFSEEDLRVKVMGGFVRLDRDFDGTRWHINARWGSLKFAAGAALVSDIAGSDSVAEAGSSFGGTRLPGAAYPIAGDYPGVLTTIERNGSLFYADSTGYTFVQPVNRRYTIRALGISKGETVGGIAVTVGVGGQPALPASITGWRWQSIEGDWIEYDREGRITRYGDRNDVQVSFQYSAGRVSAVLDHFGNVVMTYHHDAAGRLVEVRDVPRANDTMPARVVQYQYNGGGSLAKIVDVMGYETTYAYDGKGRLTGRTDAVGNGRAFTWAENNRITKVTEADGAVTNYKYEFDRTAREFRIAVYYPETAAGRKSVVSVYGMDGVLLRRQINARTDFQARRDGSTRTVTDAAGNETTYTEDAYGNVVRTVHPDGSAKTASFSPLHGRVLEEVDELGVKTVYEYDTRGNLIKREEAVGYPEQRTTLWAYDAYGNLLSHTIKGVPGLPAGSAEDAVTTYTYDNSGTLTRRQNAMGHQTSYEADRLGNLTSIMDARGKVWQSTFDLRGLLQTKTDPLGRTTTHAYNSIGLRTSTVAPDSATTVYSYDARRRLVAVVDPLGARTEVAYDGRGQLLSVTDPLGIAERMEYDSEGRVVAAVDGAGNRTERDYDEGGRVRSVLSAAGARTTYEYDSQSNVTAEVVLANGESHTNRKSYDASRRLVVRTDPAMRTTLYEYDALGRLRSDTDTGSATTRYAYDSRDNLLAVTDANNNTHRYEYDRLSRKVREIRPMGEFWAYEYGSTGLLAVAIDPRGNRTAYEYDDAGRLADKTVRDPQQQIAARVLFTYGIGGFLSGYEDPLQDISGSYRYDLAGRLVEEATRYGSKTFVRSRDYEANGLVRRDVYPDGSPVQYEYHPSGELAGVVLAGEQRIDYSNYVAGRPSEINYPGDFTRSQSYDGLGRPAAYSTVHGGQQMLLSLGYTYDVHGRISHKDLNSPHQAQSVSYAYDSQDRLVAAQGLGGGEFFAYDLVGNRISDTNYQDYAYDGNNRLVAGQGMIWHYDAAGSLAEMRDMQTGALARTFEYDAENRLARVSDHAGQIVAEYRYDPFGRRFQKTIYVDADGASLSEPLTTGYLYGSEGLISEVDAGSGSQVVYGYLPGSIYGTSPIFQRANSSNAYYQTDHLGAPLQLIDADAKVVWEGQYIAYGLATGVAQEGGWRDALRFPGQYYDQETGFHYNYFRDYDPQTGRYIESDPIGLRGGINTYAYALGNPVQFTDPTGEVVPAAVAACAASVACAAGAAATAYVISQALVNAGEKLFNRPKNPPDVGPPNGWIQGPRRGRKYCPDGTPELDIDNPHQGNDVPHAHEWPNGEREEPGRPVSPWPRTPSAE